jgi:nucleotide-binding universal stress UspA family protein
MTRLDGPIVVGVTSSAKTRAGVDGAIEMGAREAARLRVGLNLVCGDELPPPWARVADESANCECVRQSLTNIVDRAASAYPGLAVTGSLHAGSLARALVEASVTASLVVVCADARVHYGGLQAGLVSAQVATHAHGPVMIVPPMSDRFAGPDGALIVVVIDGSPGSADAIAFAFAQAHARDGRVHGVYATDRPNNPGLADEMLRTATEAWRHKYPDVPVRLDSVRATNPVRALNEAGAEAELIVVGARGDGGFATLLLGSVSDGLVRYARSAVAVIHR